MEGLMTLTLVQDFLAEIPETRSGLRDVQEVDGQNLPQKRFEIPDGGGAELAGACSPGRCPSQQGDQTLRRRPTSGRGHFYGVHYMSDEQKADPIHWMFGAAIAIHTANEPEDLFHEIRKDGDAEARLERLRHHPVGRFFLDDSDGLGLATIDRTGPIARRGSAKQIQWNAFSKALHPSQQNKLYGSLKPFFDVDLLPDWKVFLSIEDNMRRKAKSRLFDALGALCFHLYDAQEERHILQVLREKQEALRGDEAAPHKRAQLLVHDAALALEPGPDSKAWKAYRGKLADLIEYLCTTQALSLRNSDGHLDVTNLVRGSSPSLPDATNSGEASATLLIRGDGSVVEDQGRGHRCPCGKRPARASLQTRMDVLRRWRTFARRAPFSAGTGDGRSAEKQQPWKEGQEHCAPRGRDEASNGHVPCSAEFLQGHTIVVKRVWRSKGRVSVDQRLRVFLDGFSGHDPVGKRQHVFSKHVGRQQQDEAFTHQDHAKVVHARSVVKHPTTLRERPPPKRLGGPLAGAREVG